MTSSFRDTPTDPDTAGGSRHPPVPDDSWLRHLLETLGRPALLLDAERNVVAANSAAGRLRRDALMTGGGRLACEDDDSDVRLARAVRDVLVGRSRPGRPRRRTLNVKNLTRSRILFVTVARLELAPAAQADGSGPLALVMVYDPQAPLRLDVDGLAELFELTPAELRVTEVLVDGHSPAVAAQRLNLSEGTVRAHLRTIFKKTGTHRQAELVRLLTRFWYP